MTDENWQRPAIKADPNGYAPRGMSREEAARWIGVGTTKFDQLVKDRRMPKPRRIDGRVVWDRYALDQAFSALPDDNVNEIDKLLAARAKR